MSEKSKGDTSRVVNNPLLSASVTGLTFDDFPSAPLLLPAAPPVERSPPPVLDISSDTKETVHGHEVSNDSDTFSEINLNAPADEDFNQLGPPSFISPLEENPAATDASLLSQAATSFSQLPSVASTVFSTFSKVIKEYSPNNQDNDYTNSVKADQPVPASFDSFYAPASSSVDSSSLLNLGPGDQPSSEPPKFYSPAEVPALSSATQAQSLNQNTYRLSAKKKTYAQIPGLSSNAPPPPTSILAPPTLPPAIQTAPAYPAEPQQSESSFSLAANESSFANTGPVFSIQATSADVQPFVDANPITSKKEERRGLFSLSNVVAPVWQNLSGLVSRGNNQEEVNANNPYTQGPVDQTSSFSGVYAVQSASPAQYFTNSPQPFVNEGTISPTTYVATPNAPINANTASYFTPDNQAAFPLQTQFSGKVTWPLPPKSVTPVETLVITPTTQNFPEAGISENPPKPVPTPPTSFVPTTFQQPLPSSIPQTFPPLNPSTSPVTPYSLTSQTLSSTSNTPLAPPPTAGNSFRLQKGTRHYKTPLGISTNPVSSSSFFSSNAVANPQAPKQFAPFGSAVTESPVVNQSATNQPLDLFVPVGNQNNPQSDQQQSIQPFVPFDSTLTEKTSESNQLSTFQPLTPFAAPGIQNILGSKENPAFQPFAGLSTATTELFSESTDPSATFGTAVTESTSELNKSSTTSFFAEGTENISESGKPPPIGFITSGTFPAKPTTTPQTTYVASNLPEKPQQFDQKDPNQLYTEQSKIASPFEEGKTGIFQPQQSTQNFFPALPAAVATAASLVGQFTPETPSAPPAEPAPLTSDFSFDRQKDETAKNNFGLQKSNESVTAPPVSKIDSSDILKEDNEIESIKAEIVSQTEIVETSTVVDKPKEFSTANFFAPQPGIVDANKIETASFIENLQPIKTFQPSICEVSQQSTFENKQSRNLGTTPSNKLETSSTIGSSSAFQPFNLNNYFSPKTADIPASNQSPIDINANKPSEEVLLTATTVFQSKSCSDSAEFFSPTYTAEFNKNIAEANLTDPRSFFDSFQQQTVISTPVLAQQLDDEVNSNFSVDRKSEIENSFQIQNFFNNPPQNLNQSASDLNYKLVGSNLAKHKYIDELSSSRAISPQSNVVEPPSSACSEFSADTSLQSNLNTSKVSNVEADILLDSLIKEYIDDPEIMALLMNNKPSTSANASYKPAVKHWFCKRKVDDKLIWSPFSHHDSELIESHFNNPTATKIVAVEGGRYDVNIDERHRLPIYWSGEATEVRRCSWFYKALDSRYVPYEEDIAEKLETEYEDAFKTNEWHRKIPLPTGETVVFHGPTVLVHFLQTQSSDSWGTATQTTSRPRIVKRDLEDFSIETGESNKVDHLLFMVHGIGSVCDLKFRTVEEVVDEFRSIATQLIQSHYKISCESDRVGRVEVLPVSWHSELHSEESGIDEKLKAITLESIPKLRNFANDTLLDVLFYTSPVFCQNIMDTVAGTMNKLYSKYCQRNPSFSGGVSLAGHSLGSLILFDLLCHQKPVEMADLQNSENPDQPITPIQIRAQTPVDEEDMTKKQISYTIGPAGTGQAYISYPQLVFQPKKFFALGSPIGMFVTIRGIDRLGLEFKLPTCPGFFNIFHPYDPVAYRVEALVNTALSTARPVLVPHHKGRKRMHLELKETMTRVGADIKQRIVDTFKNTMETVYHLTSKHKTTPTTSEIEKEVDKVLEMQLNMDKENGRTRTDSVSGQSDIDTGEIDQPLGRLNDGKRIDYVLQEAPLEFFNEYLFALTSHVCYWESADTILFIMKEIYSSLGVQTDSQVPQQSMTIKRPNSNAMLSPDSSASMDSPN